MQVQTSKMHGAVPLAVMPDATLELDADGRIVRANDLALEMFGYAADELDGQPGARLLPTEELFADAGAARCVKLVGRRANGTPFPLDATLRRIDDVGAERALCAIRELDDDALVGEAQRYFDVAFDNAPIGMALFNCDGEYVRVNAALCDLLGRREHDLVGRRDQELTHPDDRQADLDAAWAILEGAYGTHQCEKRFVRPDGSIVWALANLTFLRDDGGRPLSWVGQFQDITARRAAEEALRASEERHRLVVRNLPGAAIVLYDPELRCVLIEGRQVEDAGVVATEVAGRSMREIVPPELLPVLEPAARRALEGEASQLEMRSSRAGRVLRAEVVPHHDAHGRIAGVLVAVRDVTEQRAAERATRDAEERFRLAFDHAPIGIALVAPDGRWLRVNRRLCEMTGYAQDELLSRTFQDITHPDDMDADLEHVRAMLAGEIRTYEMEKRYLRADGSVIWILLSVSLVCDDEHRPLYFISQIQDIDERKRAQGELERLAHRDALTGIPNRRAWEVALERAVHDARHSGRPLAAAVIDLNDFKAVNDSHGHDAGDRLLEQAAAAWQGQLRGSDVLARIGGDEFAVLLPDCAGGDADAVVRRLRGALAHPAGCAIGVALWAGDSPSELMRRADEALYADKRSLSDARPASAARD